MTVTTASEQVRTGIALYTDLHDLLQTERSDLVKQTVSAMDANNRRRQTLLDEISVWQNGIVALLPKATDQSAEPTRLTMLFSGLPEGQKRRALSTLTELETLAQRTRKLAAVNHILVARQLKAVDATLDVFTGGNTHTTYDGRGGVAKAPSHVLLARKG